MAIQKAVLVLSGKGGVGKTIVAINIALFLRDAGHRVGLLDADFSASNSGYFLDIKGEVNTSHEKFSPVVHEGLEVFSIPLLIGEGSVSMEGSQYSQLIRDAVQEANWASDYLVVDCPAGFGDELKAAAKALKDVFVGSVIVVQPAHVLDAHRTLRLHKDLEMQVLGLIENMSYFKAGAITYNIFGDSVVDELGKEYGVPVFGKIPLSMEIRDLVEAKKPKLPEAYAEPIVNTVKAIEEAKVKRPGFLEKVKDWLRGSVEDFIVEFALTVNTELSIPQIQEKFGYPGGTVIRLNVMDDDMDRLIARAHFIVHGGKLALAETQKGEEVAVGAQIDITPKALKWALLANKVLADGRLYTLEDALRLGHLRIYGDRSMVRGAHFLRHVFSAVGANSKAMGVLRPLLEVL